MNGAAASARLSLPLLSRRAYRGALIRCAVAPLTTTASSGRWSWWRLRSTPTKARELRKKGSTRRAELRHVELNVRAVPADIEQVDPPRVRHSRYVGVQDFELATVPVHRVGRDVDRG